MEAMISIAQSGGALSSLPDEPASSLDELALDRADDRQRDEDERGSELISELEMPKHELVWQPPLPKELAFRRESEPIHAARAMKAVRADRQDGLQLTHELSSKKNTPPLLDAQQGKLAPTPTIFGQGALQLGEPRDDAMMAMKDVRQVMPMSAIARQGGEHGMGQNVDPMLAMQAASDLAELAPARSKDASSHMKKYVAPQSAQLVSPQLMSDIIPLANVQATHQPALPQAARLRAGKQEPGGAPPRGTGETMASTVSTAAEAAQNGLTYQFRRWGNEHSVTVQGTLSGNLLLQPSDVLVAQRLGEQWQSGNPQQWQLARDGGEGRGQQQPQQDEEDESGC
ncbi:type III secretion system needle length determinant, SpaN/EivJ family [Chromobacterium amazonense]|uniref:SpaN/EivJ family type III secretion system needle length determinant n=3 Tax=Chromobacterium amazonense TaxID=1382803 RepID=UPI0031F65D32